MKATIYTKDNCPYCVKAKAYLAKYDIEYEEIVIEKDITREAFLKIVPNARTVPQVFINDELIGGWNELSTYFDVQGHPI